MYILRYIVAHVVWTYMVRAIAVKFVDLTAWDWMDQYTHSDIYDECTDDFHEAREAVESKYGLKLKTSPHYFDTCYEYPDIEAYGDRLISSRYRKSILLDWDNRGVTFIVH